MLPCPTTPRAGQSRLWQNWACGSIGGPPQGWLDDQTRRDARWTRVLSSLYPRITVEGGGTAPAEPGKNLKAMRVSDLLRMSTGHQSEPSLRTEEHWTKSFLAQPVPHKPGTHFLYN